MRIFVMSLIAIINLIIQSTFNIYFSPFFILPNTMIVIVISYAISRNDIEGAIYGFLNGLLYDIMFGRIIGLYALIGLLVGFISAKPFRELSPSNLLLSTSVIFAMSIVYNFLFYIFAYLFRGRVDIAEYFLDIILPEAILNGIIAIMIYPLIYFINKRLEEYEKPKRKMFGTVGGNGGKV